MSQSRDREICQVFTNVKCQHSFLWQLNYLKFDKFPLKQQSIAKSEVEKLQTARLLCSVFLKSVHALLLQTRFGNGEIIGLQIITSLVIVFVSQIWPRIVASN